MVIICVGVVFSLFFVLVAVAVFYSNSIRDMLRKRKTIADSMAIVDHKWEMRVEVGRGAFAIVELVRQPKNDIAMILKTVSKNKYEIFREKPQVSLTHANEICILQTLDHTRIIKLRWFEEDEMNVYMTFDYMEGGDLLADIMLHGLLPEEFGRSHAVQLCEGLLYLDVKRVVHRDMKPENVLLDRIHREHRHIRIADFGVSRFCGSKENVSQSAGRQCLWLQKFMRCNAATQMGTTNLWTYGVSALFSM